MKKPFLAMALASLFLLGACRGGETPAEPVESTPTTSAPASNHKHSYGEWKVVKEPTCSEKGQKERTCECGEKQTQDIATTDHTYGEWKETKAPGCDTEGEKEKECTVCHKKETEAIPAAGHAWGPETEVAAKAEGEVGYKTATCTKDGKVKIEFLALDGTWAEGSENKSTTPAGYLKISKNDMAISYKISAEKVGKAKLYAYGCMDYWNSSNSTYNVDRSFFNDGTPNFAITLNGENVEVTNKKTYGEMLTGPDADYSEDGLMEIGDIELKEGVTEMVMTRKASYNPLIKSFLFII